MATPTKSQIEKLAVELWQKEQVRKGCMELAGTNPEYEELLESGYVAVAQSILMRNSDEYRDFLLSELGENPEDVIEKTKSFKFDFKQALANGVYISGTSGSGKSDLAMMHACVMMQQGVTVIVFDATRDWINRSSIPHYITVRPNVQFSFKLNISTIFDMSQLPPKGKFELVRDICETIRQHQFLHGRTGESPIEDWIYVIFEEAHLYFPQGCMRAKRYATLVEFATTGRNFATRFEAIVQFSSMIDKDMMKYMKQRYFGYTDEPNDIDYVTSFIGRRKERDDYTAKLMNLKAGQFIYKHGNKVSLVEIEPFQSRVKSMPLQLPAVASQRKVETRKELQQDISVIDQFIVFTQLAAMAIFIFMIIYTIATMP